MVRSGMVWQVGRGLAGYGAVRQVRRGQARNGTAGFGMVWQVRRGAVRTGEEWLGWLRRDANIKR